MVHYLIYLRKSFKCNLRKHISLCLILTCALLLPLLVSVYRDSSAYGMSQSLITQSKGQTFHILNVTEDDCRYFENITGLSEPCFQDNTIYLKINNEEEWKNSESVTEYGHIVLKRVDETCKDGVVVKAYDFYSACGISTDSSFLSEQIALLVMNVILIVLASLIIQSSYRSHLLCFSADMKSLSFCGADKHQINTIFVVEFIAIYLMSSICAVLISAGVMKALFWLFLEIKEVPGLAWVIFHMDVKNTAIHLAIYFLSLGVVLFYSLKQFHTCSTVSFESVSASIIRKRKIRAVGSPALSLAKLWCQRTNRVFRSCLCVSIPLISIFLFLFNYLMLNLSSVGKPPQYEIIISNYSDTFEGFTADDIAYIEAMGDVQYVDIFKGISPDEYVIEAIDGMIFPTRLLPMDSEGLINEAQSKYEIAVSRNCTIKDHHIGEKFSLRKLNAIINGNGGNGDQSFELVVTEILDVDTVDWAVDIYMHEDILAEIMESVPSCELKIKLRNVDSHHFVEQSLRNRFPGAEYEIVNYQVSVDFMHDASSGFYLLLAYIFAIIFVLVLLILYAKLSDYVNDCMDIAKTLYIVGAEKRNLYLSFILQASGPALVSAILPVVISLPASCLVAKSLGEVLPMDGTMLLVYITSAILVTVVYLYPIHSSLRRNMRKF